MSEWHTDTGLTAYSDTLGNNQNCHCKQVLLYLMIFSIGPWNKTCPRLRDSHLGTGVSLATLDKPFFSLVSALQNILSGNGTGVEAANRGEEGRADSVLVREWVENDDWQAALLLCRQVQSDNSTCSKPPVDFKPKVPLWPDLSCPGQAETELLFWSQQEVLNKCNCHPVHLSTPLPF